MNHKIDIVSLKLMSFLLSVFKVNSIKLSRNDVDQEAEEMKKVIEKIGICFYMIDSISTLFFEWNPLVNYELRKELFVGTVKPSIQHLILRDNELGDEIFKDLI